MGAARRSFVAVAALIPADVHVNDELLPPGRHRHAGLRPARARPQRRGRVGRASSTSGTSPSTASARTATRCSRRDNSGSTGRRGSRSPSWSSSRSPRLLARACRRGASSGDYLAIVTLFFGLIFVIRDPGVSLGLARLRRRRTTSQAARTASRRSTRGGSSATSCSSVRAYIWVTLAGFVVVALALAFANQSRTGRAWRALRDDSLAAEAMSMPVNRLKLLAVAVGAGVAGLAGTINGGAAPGRLSRRLRLRDPDHHLRDGDPRGRREPCRASSSARSSIKVLARGAARTPTHAALGLLRR